MAKMLSVSELKELKRLIDALDQRVTANGSESVKRIRAILGLASAGRGEKLPDPTGPEDEVPLRKQLLQRGIESLSYRDMRLVRERRAAKKR